MPAAEYRSETSPFVNRGLVQKLDPALLDAGQYVDLTNATSVQEGALTTRYGAWRSATPSVGDLVHTLEMFRISASTAEQFVYIGEGTDIFRVKLSDLLGTATVATNMGAALDSSTWGQRWTSVKYDPGTSRAAYFFVASLSKMLKDRAIGPDGSMITPAAFQNWGIVPPAQAPTAANTALTTGTNRNVVTLAGTPVGTWTTSPDQSNTVKVVDLFTTGTVDFSTFGNVASGSALRGYENDDIIELTFTPKNPARFDWWLLEIDVSTVAGTYTDYYSKYIIPYQGTTLLNQTGDPIGVASTRSGLDEADITGDTFGTVAAVPDAVQPGRFDFDIKVASDVTGRSKPIEAIATKASDSGTPDEIVVQIKKSEFLKVGSAGVAGASGTNWKNITHIRLQARSLAVGGANLTITTFGLKMIGGNGPYNDDGIKQPYRWAYTFKNDATGFESNPCPLMVDTAWITDANRRGVTLTFIQTNHASPDTQIASTAVYRAGGAFVDGYYRLVGYTTTGTFLDVYSDNDIRDAPVLEFDNDPPVSSTLPTSMKASMAAVATAGLQSALLTISQPSGVNASTFLRVGTRLQITDTDKSEEVQITAISTNTITAYFQNTHPNGATVTAEFVTGQPCRLSTIAGDSVFLAGDTNNPHILYKSKTGRPEAFPTIVEATGAANQVVVGSPSNRIMAITEFRDHVVCMNLENIYTVRIFNGEIMPPQETPAQRGLLTHFGWTKADNALYYLSHDGIYSWSGGQSTKVSEPIDWFFKGQTIGGIVPLSLTEADLTYVHMAYFRNEVHFIGRNTSGDTVHWKYHTLYDRWTLNTPAVEGTARAYTCLLAYQEYLFSARSITVAAVTSAYVYREETGTADNGVAIPFSIQTGFYTHGDPSVNKQYGDIIIEYTNATGTDISVKTFYNFSTSVDQTLALPTSATRTRLALPIQTGSAKEAYAIAFQFTGSSAASGGATLHSITFNWLPLAKVQRGRAGDWDDAGYPHDKRLDQLVIEYDTGGNAVTLNMDVIHGYAGATQALAVATFSLNSVGRAKATLPIRVVPTGPPAGFTANGMVVCKALRLRPTATSTDFKIWDYTVTHEKYPPDTIYFTDPSDYGNPYQKYWQQLVIDVDTGGFAATCEVFIDDGTTGTPTKYQSLSINTTSATRQQTITLNTGIVGKKARLVIQPNAAGKFQVFSHTFITTPADKGPVHHTFDWDDLGWPHDKRLKSVTFEYEVTAQTTMRMFALTGIGSAQADAEITSPAITLYTGGRKLTTVQLGTATTTAPIAKMIRFQPTATNTVFNSWRYTFDFDKLPPDVVSETEWQDGGYPYEKYLQQLLLEMDTGNVACRVDVITDTAATPQIKETFSVTTTDGDRVRLLTIPSVEVNQSTYGGTEAAPPLEAKKWKLKFTPGTGGKSQYYTHNMSWVKSDPGPVEHSMDWDKLEWPYDKRIKSITIEYDGKGTAGTQVYIDTLTGITGSTITSAAKTLTLTGAGRGLETFDLMDSDLIVKALRVRPVSILIHNFRMWRYSVDKDNYPRDITRRTEWDDLEYPCEKILQSVVLTVDTGGVAASVALQKDGGTVLKTFTVNTTNTNRTHVESLHSDNIGYKFRLVSTPGTGGKFQLWNYNFNRVLEPCWATRFDSYEQYAGSVGYRYVWQVWIEYVCTGTILVSIYVDGGKLFYTKILPVHTYRDVDSFMLPASVGTVLNKSKGHRVVVEALDTTKPFKMYMDSSRLEIRELSGDMRGSHRQFYLSERMGPVK